MNLKNSFNFFLAPSSESTFYSEKYKQLLSCVANNVQKNLSGEQFEEFRQLLDGYANESEKAIADMEELLKNGPPRPNEQLMFYLGSIQETVKSCEDSLGISVEF